MAKLKTVRSCFSAATKLSDKEVALIDAAAEKYNSGNQTADYISAVADRIAAFQNTRTEVQAALDAARPAPVVETPAEAPVVTPAPPVVETPAEAWDAMDTGVEWAKLSPGQQTEWTDSNRTQATADTIAETPEAKWSAMSDVPWENLSDELKKKWGDAKVRDDDLVDAIEYDHREDIRAESDAQDKLSEAINAVENFRGTETDFRTIVDAAYFLKEETNTKDITARAQAYVNKINSSEKPGDSVKKDMLRTATIEVANSSTLAHGNYAKYKTGTNEGAFKPWYILLRDANLLDKLNITVSGLTLPEAEAAIAAGLDPLRLPKDTLKKLKKKPVAASVSRTVSPPVDYVVKLKDLIVGLIYATGVARTVAAVRKDAKEFYAKISEQDRKTIVQGAPLSSFFDADGEPKIIMSRGRPVLTDKAMTTAQQRVLEVEQKDTAKALAAAASAEFKERSLEQQRGIEALPDTEGGMKYRDDGTPITSTVPVGRIRLLVNSFLSKLRIKPTTHIYANVADLKARNPKLYARAAAARAAGDFDTVAAVGYAFGPDVIIFSDFVRTEQQLKFVLAHESLGHFGFRSVVPGPVLDAMLNRIYDADYDVQAAVEAMMSVQGMSKLEAIEEYLADNAADLDSSVISKIWNVLKNALNKLGFEFQDDEARYLVNLARKYVRNGDVGHVVSSKAIAEGLTAIDRASSTGRFARADAGNLVSRTLASVASIRGSQSDYTGGLLGVANSFAQNVFGKRRDAPGVVARLLEELQTLDNKARRSYGLQQLHMMLEAQSGEAQQLLNKYKSMMEATYTPDVFGLAKGVSEDDKREAGKLLAHAALLRSRKVTDAFLKSFPDLVRLTSADQIDIPHLEAVRKQLEAAGEVTAEEFTKGFDIEYSALGADGKPLTKRFQYDVDTESNVWKVYQEARATINEAAIDMLLANFESSRAETNRVIGGLNNKRRGSNVFTDMDLAAIRRVSNLYKATRYKSSSVSDASVRLDKQSLADAEALIQSFGRAIASDDIFAVWMKDPAAKGFIANDAVTKGSDITHAEFQKPEYDDIRAQLASLRSKVADIDASYVVQKAVRDVFLFDYQTRNAELYAKRTILGAYVPFVRRGNEQVRLVAYDLDGNPAELSDDVRSTLPYFQFNDRAEAEDAVADLEKEFGGDNEWTLTTPGPKGAPTPITIKLVPEISRVRRTPDLTEAVNFNEFIYVLNRLNVNLTPTVRERIVTTLTNQNSRARKNLQRSGTEGWDTDVVRSVSEHLETSAHVAAKKMYRHRTDDILLNNSNWLGDSKLLKQLEAAIDNATDDGERARAQKAYDSYAYQYRYMAASSGMNKVTIAGKEVSTLGRGEDYREYAKEILRWYSENTNISESTEDILSGEVGSQLKLMAVVMQLGMSPASAVLNLVSLETHTIPYLAFYNPKHGYGGGYGWMKSATAVHTALANLRSPKLGDAAFLADLVAGKTKNTFGLSDAEISFLFDLSSKGVLQMSQANTMMGNARGKIFNNNMQGAIQTWMGMFTYTEQLTRRATALATFRLEKERALSQGVPEAQANAEATEAARVAVNTSQGDHNMYNRPKIGRGNITQFIFMYKMFLVTTVQLLRHMPKEGQLLMLGSLLLLSGMKGLPFAEDLMDIVDTIAQKLGLKTASAEKAMAEWIDTVAPGMSPYAMRGVIDRMTGATVSTRTGVGNMIPLTGVFKAGAQPGREIADFVGPVWGALAGSVGMAGNLLRYGADTVGLGNDTTSFNSILRESPVAALRSVGDGLAYLNDGRITNLRGQVVASDVSTNVILARFLGFYPAEATQANDIVRLSKQVADYAKSIKAEYVGAYIKADLRNDTAGVQQVLRNVEQWNQDAAGTGLEISNFAQSANRAAQESKRPLLQRYLKAAPKNVRPETEELMRVLGYN